MLVSAGGGGGSEAPLPLADMAELRSRLIAKDAALLSLESSLESSEEILAEWQAKYDRLFEAHRKLQKTNNSLEDKLLRIVDKFESDKNQMTRDLASQTQKLVQAKLTIQQLHDQNSDLSNDLHLSITLLQNRPSSYLAQRVDSLPQDMQVRVRSYIHDKQQERHCKEKIEGKKIRVPIMDDVSNVGDNEKVSAAILAKVLEERAKERKKEHKFCIDIGTQTHGWHFPDKIYQSSSSSTASSNNNPNPSTGSSSNQTSSPTSANGDAPSSTPPAGPPAPAVTAPPPLQPPIPSDSSPQLVQLDSSPPSSTAAGVTPLLQTSQSIPNGKLLQKKHQTNSRRLLTSTSSPSATSSAMDQGIIPLPQQPPLVPFSSTSGNTAGGPETAEVIQILRSISIDETATNAPQGGGGGSVLDHPILLASVIRTPPASLFGGGNTAPSSMNTSESDHSIAASSMSSRGSNASSRSRPTTATKLTRSSTFSKMQTDI